MQDRDTPDSGRHGLEQEVFDLHARAMVASGRLVPPVQFPTDLTMQQIRCLRVVMRAPGLPVNALAHELGVSAATASGLVERLVEKALLERRDDPGDRRVRRLHLTGAGLDAARRMEAPFERMMSLIVAELTEAELLQLKASSLLMLAGIDRAAQRRGTPREE